MSFKLNGIWGHLRGSIYADFSLRNPQRILTAQRDRQFANPVFVYEINQPKRWQFILNGYSPLGKIGCHLYPATHSWIGFPAIRGDVTKDMERVGSVTAGRVRNAHELALFALSWGEPELFLERIDVMGGEGDAIIRHKNFGPIARFPQLDYSWQELYKSRMGFGRLRVGAFDFSDESNLSPGIQVGAIVLVCLYLCLLKPLLNTDSGAS
jgi:hypothetical protein